MIKDVSRQKATKTEYIYYMKTKGLAPVIILFIIVGILIIAGVGCTSQFRKPDQQITQPPPGTQPDQSGLPLAQCLPAGIKLSDEVGMKNTTDQFGHILESTPITLQEKLLELNAVCGSDKTLTNDAGKVIYLYSDSACWQGVAPSNYQELLTKQSNEVKALERSYIVIEIPCNGFVPIPP